MTVERVTRRHEDRLGFVLEQLYDAAVDDSKWQGLAAAIAQAFDSTSAVIKTYGGPQAPELSSVTGNLQVSAREQAWSDHWHRNDLWFEHAVPLGMGHVFISQDLMTDAQLERTGFYQDWIRGLDIHHMAGVLFPAGQGETGVLGVHRARGASPYGEADRRQLQALFPHVRRALGLRNRLRRTALAHSAALQALERIDMGVLVLDARRTVLYANGAAEQLLRSTRELRMQGPQLCLADAHLDGQLARHVREASETAEGTAHLPGAALALPRPQRLPITLRVSPWRATWAPADVARPAALVFIRDPEASPSSAGQTLRELFGLTRAEAAVAVAVGEGRSPEQIAAGLGVGLGTVRTHLNQALAKTATGRQGALAALVARSVASMADHG